jgi:hypothetical protein
MWSNAARNFLLFSGVPIETRNDQEVIGADVTNKTLCAYYFKKFTRRFCRFRQDELAFDETQAPGPSEVPQRRSRSLIRLAIPRSALSAFRRRFLQQRA